MKDNKKCRIGVEIDDLMDHAIKNALIRRNEGLVPLTDEQAQSISGGASSKLPLVHGVIINPNPQPSTDPYPYPVVHGVIIHGIVVHGVLIKPNA